MCKFRPFVYVAGPMKGEDVNPSTVVPVLRYLLFFLPERCKEKLSCGVRYHPAINEPSLQCSLVQKASNGELRKDATVWTDQKQGLDPDLTVELGVAKKDQEVEILQETPL